MKWNDDSIAETLESVGTLIPVATAHSVVPAKPGFYSIFVDKPQSLPSPFDHYLRAKNTRLIYIGVASGSLYGRLIEQDLRHQKPSTFFRGIGAILGYRPPSGSLFGRRNQNNYKFSTTDTASIEAWNREHLFVRFVAVNTSDFPDAERRAIGRNCPILNTTHNAKRLDELADLRALCRSIACGTTE